MASGQREFTLSLYRGRGGGGPFKEVCPKNHIKLTTCSTEYRIQNTEYRPQNTAAAKLTDIKLPMYLFFI